MKEQKLIENLYNFVYTKSELSCTKCGAIGYCPGNDDEAVHEFKIGGWYATDNNVYCPSCNQKRKGLVKKRADRIKKKSPAKKRKPAHR